MIHLFALLILSPSHTDIIFRLTILHHVLLLVLNTNTHCSTFRPPAAHTNQAFWMNLHKHLHRTCSMWQSHGHSKLCARLDDVWLGPTCWKVQLLNWTELNLVFQEKHSITRTSSNFFWQRYVCCRQYLQILETKVLQNLTSFTDNTITKLHNHTFIVQPNYCTKMLQSCYELHEEWQEMH